MSDDQKRIQRAQDWIRANMLQHSMSCEYPEGCSCGASIQNEASKIIIAGLEKVKGKV
jgi:hypothetical protein